MDSEKAPMPPANRPTLILIGGPPGAGKSTLATALSARCHIPVLDKDTVKSTLLDIGVEELLAGRASYDLLLSLATDLLQSGQIVILDAPGKYQNFLDGCKRIAANSGGTFSCILCHASPEIRRKRLRQRIPRASQWTVLPDARDELDSWRAAFPANSLILDGSSDLSSLVDQVVSWLDLRCPQAPAVQGQQ